MSITVYNPQKGRLETIDVAFTNDNTTWFGTCRNARDIFRITDYHGGILISQFDYTRPFRIYGVSRADLGYNQRKARQLLSLYD
ncbi:MAG: hypothetical protein WC331_11580 [Candidatus Omnitrophota bacterium]|jgi:hypothetical protein